MTDGMATATWLTRVGDCYEAPVGDTGMRAVLTVAAVRGGDAVWMTHVENEHGEFYVPEHKVDVRSRTHWPSGTKSRAERIATALASDAAKVAVTLRFRRVEPQAAPAQAVAP